MQNWEIFCQELLTRAKGLMDDRSWNIQIICVDQPDKTERVLVYFVSTNPPELRLLVDDIPGKRVEIYPYDAASIAEISVRKMLKNLNDFQLK
jgi:hypothetical protein